MDDVRREEWGWNLSPLLLLLLALGSSLAISCNRPKSQVTRDLTTNLLARSHSHDLKVQSEFLAGEIQYWCKRGSQLYFLINRYIVRVDIVSQRAESILNIPDQGPDGVSTFFTCSMINDTTLAVFPIVQSGRFYEYNLPTKTRILQSTHGEASCNVNNLSRQMGISLGEHIVFPANAFASTEVPDFTQKSPLALIYDLDQKTLRCDILFPSSMRGNLYVLNGLLSYDFEPMNDAELLFSHSLSDSIYSYDVRDFSRRSVVHCPSVLVKPQKAKNITPSMAKGGAEEQLLQFEAGGHYDRILYNSADSTYLRIATHLAPGWEAGRSTDNFMERMQSVMEARRLSVVVATPSGLIGEQEIEFGESRISFLHHGHLYVKNLDESDEDVVSFSSYRLTGNL